MKLMIFLTCISLHVTANVFSQKVSIHFKNVSLVDVLKEIESQSDVRFVYSSEFLNNQKPININVKEKPVKTVLNAVLKDSNLEYSESGNKLFVISPKQDIVVSGTVKNQNGEPLSGATVRVRGTSIATSTDNAGRFRINVPKSSTLTVSYLGYSDYSIEVDAAQDLEIQMQATDDTNIDEVVVVAYGTQNKSKISDAISTVKMDDVMKDRPVSSAGMALEGALPGLNVYVESGMPGAKPSLNIRGYTSLNGGGPLYVVDNIPMEDISLLNPADFESVSVLKDASASVLYGARAAFGVVLITTKKGRLNQPTSFYYSTGYALNRVSTLPEKLSIRDWVDVMLKIGQEKWWAGQDFKAYDEILKYYDQNPDSIPSTGYTIRNGIKYPIRPSNVLGQYFEGGNEFYHNVSASGGSDKTFFRSSVRYVNENGSVIGNNDLYKRWTADNSLTSQITSNLIFSAKVQYNSFNRREPGDGFGYPFYAMMSQPSFTPSGYDMAVTKDGQEKLLPYGTQNHLVVLQNPKEIKGDQLRLTGTLKFEPIKNLVFTGEYNFDKDTEQFTHTNNHSLVENIQPERMNHEPNIRAQEGTSYTTSNWLQNRNTLNIYGKYTINTQSNHNAEITAGTNQEYVTFHKEQMSRGYLLSISAPSVNTGIKPLSGFDEGYKYAVSGYFGQVRYDYDGKYILQLSGRYDGSSRFPEGRRFGFYPSLSVAWNMAQEEFMSPLTSTFSVIKPRLSYGSIGNQVIYKNGGQLYYPTIPTMNAVKSGWLNTEGNIPFVTVQPPNIVTADLTWERVKTLGLGLDLNAFNNKLSVSFDYFNRHTTGMITDSRPLPAVLGTSAPQENGADLKSTGFELNLGWSDRIGNVSYNLAGNFYDDKGIITKFDNPAGFHWNYYVGKELGEIWGYESLGLYQINHFTGLNAGNLSGTLTQDAINAGFVPQDGRMVNPGDMAYVDLDSNGKIDDGENTLSNPGDRKVIGNTSHRYRFGLNGSVSYKGLDFSFMISGVGKRQFYSWNAAYHPFRSEYLDILPQNTDFWTPENTDAHFYRLYPHAGWDQWKSMKEQTRYLQNGAYVRVKNLGLGYTLPTTLIDQVKMKKVRVFFSAENPFTFDHLPKGVDPMTADYSEGGTYPYLRKFNFGVNLTF